MPGINVYFWVEAGSVVSYNSASGLGKNLSSTADPYPQNISETHMFNETLTIVFSQPVVLTGFTFADWDDSDAAIWFCELSGIPYNYTTFIDSSNGSTEGDQLIISNSNYTIDKISFWGNSGGYTAKGLNLDIDQGMPDIATPEHGTLLLFSSAAVLGLLRPKFHK